MSYTFLKMGENHAPLGFAVDFAKPIAPMGNGSLGIVGEIGVNRFSEDSFTWTTKSFLGGVRFSGPSTGSAQLFGQILAGAFSGEGYTDFGLQPGFGVKFRANDNTDFKAQVDIPIDFYDGGNEKGLRLGFGVVFKLGQ